MYAQIHIGLTEKTIVIGEALGDDLWHSVKLERRGMVLSLGLDDDRPIIGKLFLRSLEFILGLVRVVQGGVLEFAPYLMMSRLVRQSLCDIRFCP